jgi:hypothetical protein
MKFEKSERFKDSKGLKVRRDAKSIKKIADEAVKNVYQHVSSPVDEKYAGQRKAIALRFRRRYNSNVHRRTCANRTHTPHMRAFELKRPERRSAEPCVAQRTATVDALGD